MPRGVVLTPEVEQIIAHIYIKHPELRSKPQKFYEEVHRQVHESIDWAEPDWPGLSTVKKRLVALREKERNRKPESKEIDKPWSIFSLREYAIPSEALPAILEMWVWMQDKLDMKLTIREARWIARLHTVTENFPKDLLSIIVQMYATCELATELLDNPQNMEPFQDLIIWSMSTESPITHDLWEKIYRDKGKRKAGTVLTRDELDLFREWSRELGRPIPFGILED